MVSDEPWRALADGIELRGRVTPRGGRDAIEGIGGLEGAGPVLRLRVRVPPTDGQANEAARRLLADTLECPHSAVSLHSGAAAGMKVFRVEGVRSEEGRAAFATIAGASA